MIEQVKAFLANQPDDHIQKLKDNPTEAIKNVPTSKFQVKKPSRALQVHACCFSCFYVSIHMHNNQVISQIMWMEESRAKWMLPERQRQIYDHFVYNGKVPYENGGDDMHFVRFSEREEWSERVFGESHSQQKKAEKKKEKQKKKADEREETVLAAVRMLVGLRVDLETPKHVLVDYECLLNGSDDPSVSHDHISDLRHDGDASIEYEA